MSFTYPRRSCITGCITAFFIYKTNTGDMYEYRFEHSADGIVHEIPLCTRNKRIEDEFQAQLFASPKWKLHNLGALPLAAKVLMSSDGVGFEVFEIEILE